MIEALDEQRVLALEQIVRVLDEYVSAMAGTVESEVERRVNDRLVPEMARAAAHARREMSERLNQSARRLEHADSIEAWMASLLDGAHAFAPRTILFSVNSGIVRWEGQRVDEPMAIGDLNGFNVPLADAPALNGVVETLDTVIAVRGAGELSQRLAEAVGDDPDRRACLLPVLVGRGEGTRRVAAIVYAESDGEPLDVNILEAICATAGAVHDCRLLGQKLTSTAKAGAVLSIAPAAVPVEVAVDVPASAPPKPEPPGPDWSRLSPEEQEVHLKAQRFARVRVAEMRLYLSHQVKEGRAHKRLYMALRGEMDRGRAQFKHEYLHTPTMVDYFHQEILRTLANDDASLLGPEYPGPLV